MTEQRVKVYELVLFNNIFVQLFWSTFGSFFLVLPSIRLFGTFDIQTDLKMKLSLTLGANSEAYSGPCQTSKMEVFAQILNGFYFLTIFLKSSILDVWQDSQFASKVSYEIAEKAPSQMFDRVLNLLLKLDFHQCNMPYRSSRWSFNAMVEITRR